MLRLARADLQGSDDADACDRLRASGAACRPMNCRHWRSVRTIRSRFRPMAEHPRNPRAMV